MGRAAFAAPGVAAVRRGGAFAPARCVAPARQVRATRGRRVVWAMAEGEAKGEAKAEEPKAEEAKAEEAGAEAEAEVEVEAPPEPYPGFYADLKRMGVSDDQARAQAYKAQMQANPEMVKLSGKIGGKASLIGADGKELAPWMKNVNADYKKTVVKRKGDAKGRLANDPQNQELSGQGLRAKMLGDELELSWGTGTEAGNRGFIVTRRKGKTDMWESVGDWRDKPAELASKGDEGGAYSFIVTDPAPGSWVYRISDEDGSGKVSDLSQTLVDVDSDEDSQVRLAALAALLAVLFGFVAYSLLVDPMNGTS